MENFRQGSEQPKIVTFESAEKSALVEKKAKNLEHVVKFGLLIVAAGGLLNEARQAAEQHSSTRYEITSSLNPEGETHFEHEDPETSHILNFLSGKEELTAEERELFYGSASHSENMEYEQVLTRADSARISEILWDFAQRAGAPRIRWVGQVGSTNGTFLDGSQRPGYDPDTNTIYISTDVYATDTLLAEYSHAMQYDSNPVKARAQRALDTARSVVISIQSGTSIRESHERVYDMEGGLEHEAHRTIEPALRNEFIERFDSEKGG